MGKKTFITSFILFVLSLILFEMTEIDFYLQDKLYDFNLHRWLFNDPQQIYHLIFYKLIKFPIYFIAAFVIYKCIIGYKNKTLFKETRAYLIVLLSLIIIPGGIATVGKKSISIQCPYDIPRYGGTIPFVKKLEPYPINPNRPDGKWPPGNCWPAGHASGGFALLSLYLVFKDKKKKFWAIIFGLTMGTVMSIYQMIRGAHYISHQIDTLLITLIVISFLNMVIKKENNHDSN